MPVEEGFPEVFAALRGLFDPYRAALVATIDTAGHLSLDAPPSARYPKGLFFGAVKTNKWAVAFHLMPVYVFPNLLGETSDALRRRMQGKSCFNFTRLDPALLDELSRLIDAGFAHYGSENLA